MTSFKRFLRQPLLVLLSVFCIQQVSAQELLDRVIAIVNSDIIMESELHQRTSLVSQQIAARGMQSPPADTLRQQVLDRLILENIQIQIAEEQGLRVSDRQLNETLEGIAAQNNMTLEQFRQALIAEGEDYAQAREQIRREILLNQVQQSNVNRRIQVSDQEVRNYLSSELGQQQEQAEFLLSNILVALPSQASPAMIQDAERKALEILSQLQDGADFANTAVAQSNAPNALSGGDLGWRRQNELPGAIAAEVAGMQPGSITTPIRTPSGFNIMLVRDVRGGSATLIEQSQVRHILVSPNEIRSPEQTRVLAVDLYNRLQDGQPFEELARRYSDDTGSGSLGGDLGWAQDGQMVPEFEQVMKDTPVGRISRPFESRFGWHILEVLDRRTQDVGSEMRESQARNSIRQRKYTEELDNWLREIRSQAFIDLKG